MHTGYLTRHTDTNKCNVHLIFSWLYGSAWLLNGFVTQTSTIFLSTVKKKKTTLIPFED